MNVGQIIFSPTGGTQKAADLLCRRWNVLCKIDLSAPDFAGSLDPQILAGVNAMLSQVASDRKSCELFTG